MHEPKTCPRCKSAFECKVGCITICQCYGISFSEEEKKLISDRYKGCLCRSCLLKWKNRYII
ncbi:cysteine-rich CWC family protein [Niabella aquatica]